MHTMSGKDCLTRILKIDPQAKNLIVRRLTADASTKESVVGANGFIAKPFRFTELLKWVRQTLDEGWKASEKRKPRPALQFYALCHFSTAGAG